MKFTNRLKKRFQREYSLNLNQERIKQLRLSIARHSTLSSARPVLFFNASTRLSGISQNAGFSLLTSLALQEVGVPTVQFVCTSGMSQCVLGANRQSPGTPMPCKECVRTSELIFQGSAVERFAMKDDAKLDSKLQNLSLEALLAFEYRDFSIGETILPSLRWVLRQHHLVDDEPTRVLAREYIRSAWNIKRRFVEVLVKRNPSAVVVFNGMFFPEAVVRQTALEWDITVYSHEVGMQPMSAFFTDKQATAYPVVVDEGLKLTDNQNEMISQVLETRSSGNFETAGVDFWPEMHSLDGSDIIDLENYEAIVPVFTNVIFDTSQSHANILFDQMFDWLDLVLRSAKNHPKTLFVIRAHPDEARPGKESHESVQAWIAEKCAEKTGNVVFIPPDEYLSSYDLIQKAKFVMVYNSTVGLEASMMGKPVLCAGKARFTQIPTVYLPESPEKYQETLSRFLKEKEVHIGENHQENAKRVFFSQYFRASLPFTDFFENDPLWRGYVRFKKLNAKSIHPDNSRTMRVIIDGIREGKPFLQES